MTVKRAVTAGRCGRNNMIMPRPTFWGMARYLTVVQNLCGDFVKSSSRGAFDDVLNDDVRGLFNHDPNFILGRSSAGTLSLSVDERGLRYDIVAPDTPTICDLVLSPMLRGDINQSSFAFRVARDGESWYEDDEGIVIREITRISRLYDVSPVTYPAYQDADSGVRSMKAWQEARASGALKKAVNERMARERLLTLLNA